MLDQIKQVAKAIVGFITPGVVIIGSAVTSASDGGSRITEAEWITAAVACVTTAGGVYIASNRAKYNVPESDPTSDDLEINKDQPDVPDAKPEHAAV